MKSKQILYAEFRSILKTLQNSSFSVLEKERILKDLNADENPVRLTESELEEFIAEMRYSKLL